MDVTYNNVLESTRQYFQGVPPAASGLGHGGQHAGGGGSGLALYNNIQQGGQQPQTNGPTNYYHQAQHQAQHQAVVQQQRHVAAQQQQQVQSVQPVPSYLTNGGIGAANKNIYTPSPQPSPSPHQETIRIPPGPQNKNHYNPNPQPSPSPQEHRLSAGATNKSVYSPHPQPSPSPQENIRLPSMSPFNSLSYQSQHQQAQRNRHTPTAPSPLPPISQLKGPSAASPSPSSAPGNGSYQRPINGQGGRYGSGSSYYHTSYHHQSLLQQQHDLQQQQQQLQQQLHQQQQEELKQQQAFYAGLTNSSQLHQTQHHQSQHPVPSQYGPSNQAPHNRGSTTPVNAGINLSRTPTNNSGGTSVTPVPTPAAASGVKRESPLDLSVKTVRQSADSTGQMENANADSGTTYYYFQQEGMRGHPQMTSAGSQQQSNYQSYATLQPATTPKVDFSPNFSQHAHILQSSQTHQQHHSHHPPQSQPQHQPNHHQPVQPHQQSSLAHHQQASHLHHHPNQPSHPSQNLSHHQSLEKQRWKDSTPQSYQPLPSMTSVVKTAGGSHSSHHASVNMPGTSGNVNMLSGHYHVNQLGQSLPKPAYPQDPSRYPQNYLKRPPSVDHSKVSAPTAPKQSRLDWKATIDQQIEKRFNSYLSSKGIINGEMGKPAAPAAPTAPSSYAMPARNYYDHPQVPSQHQQQHNYPVDKGSHLPPSNSAGSGNGAADKRVLSILRNSLETKEARLQQQQMVKSPLQYTELTSRPAGSSQHLYAHSHRHSLPAFQSVNAALERGPPTAFPRLSIPKAVDSIQESNKNLPPYHGANQHLPPSIHQQQPQHMVQQQQQQLQQQQLQQQLQQHHQQQVMAMQRQSGVSGAKHPSEVADLTKENDDTGMSRLSAPKQPQAANTSSHAPTPHSSSSGPPAPHTSKSGEFDGLAAFLAARIRTKAELKQQPSADQPSTPGSSSLASASLSTPNFRSPYNDLVKTPAHTSDLLSSNSKCSPWASSPKMTKDQPLAASFPRRRLFSKGEEEQPPSADSEVPPVGALPPTSASLPPRASSSHRSSSETSVFDFRESDSEGEAPTLERQPGRRPSVSSMSTSLVPQSAPSSQVIFPPTALEEELKPVDEETYEDWQAHVDDLITQLEKDRVKRVKPFVKKASSRGGRGGGRGAVTSDRPIPPSLLQDSKPHPIVIKQEVNPDAEESTASIKTSIQPASVSSVVVKEEVISETESTPAKAFSHSQVTPVIKTEFKERRGVGSKRGTRGRGRGGGPGSRGGRGGSRTKKAVYGDGSDFKTPGWEEELYKFKKSLRMPPRLINISRPLGWPKAPLSLPDLEVFPDSPCTNDSVETFPGKSKAEKDENKVDDKKPKEDDKKSIAKSLGEDQSFLDRLMAKYTARKKKIKKESPTKSESKTEEDAPELLPTPSLHGSKDPTFLGFRKETIHEFRAEFLKTGAFTAEADLPPTILETRTRTENKLIKDRLTIKEVFGTERPASAPPPGTTTDDLRRRQRLRKNKQKEKKKRMLVRAKKEKLQQASPGKNKTFRTFKRKLKSSGFDYLRKPKKKIPGPKKDADHPHKPRKKKVQPMTEEEIEETIKSWTLNKGIGETVLHRASKNGSIDVVRYLLDKLEQDPSPRDNAGYTPLHEASSRGHVAVAHLLLNYGANVEDSALGGVRPLHEAAENGFTKLVRLLLDYGADPLLATYSGATALSLAAADEESRLLMEQHIAHNGSIASSVLDDIASVPKEAGLDGFEIEESDFALPTLYRLRGESRSDSWVLFHELAPLIKVKTKEALCKILKQDSSTIIRDMKLPQFFSDAHSRAIKSAPPTVRPNSTPKVTLVKYTDEIKDLLGVEITIIPR